MKTLIIATKNKGKIAEFNDMLRGRWEVKSLLDYDTADIPENGVTFEENAAAKAEAVASLFDTMAVADDSGLEVDILNQEPGVYSARYAGPQKNDEDNINKLLQALNGVPDEKRTARFVCVIAIAAPGKETVTFRGTCEGRIHSVKEGGNGFGYDPVFFLPSYNKTMAELSSVEKNEISHRGKALRLAADYISNRMDK